MISMTGYAYKECAKENIVFSVEIKSVNSRFLDLNINLPPHFNSLESKIRSLFLEKVSRGKIDFFIRIKESATSAKVKVNEELAKSYYDAIYEFAQKLKINEMPSLSFILSQEGVLESDETIDAQKEWQNIEITFLETLEDFLEDKRREGKNLYDDISKKVGVLEECVLFFKEKQNEMEVFFKANITQKFYELLKDNVDENRIMSEVASMLVRYTINEEIVRLESHLLSLREELQKEQNGKRLDFLCQEINREINTIGSKNQMVEIGKRVILAKDALENIREQARNVE
ncbi:MAG: YicC family protein [Treponema sp.]|nr:YicC family protein [Treponema sp.]